MSLDRIKAFIIGTAMLLLGLGGASYMNRLASEDEDLKKFGVEAFGETDGASSSTKRGSTTYWLKFVYKVRGRTFKHGGSVSMKVFNKYSNGFSYSPQRIPIRYLPSDPDVVRIVDPDQPINYSTPSPWLWLLLIIWVLGGGCFVYSSIPEAWIESLKGIAIKQT